MQLSELRNLLTKLLDEDGIRRSAATLNVSLNDGYQVAAILTQGCERTQTFTFNETVQLSPLPSEFFLPVSVYWNGSRLYPIRMADLDFIAAQWLETAPKTPLYYFTLGALQSVPELWVYPRATMKGRVQLTYAIMPQRLGFDADKPHIPEEHQYVIVLWAYAWELLKERGALLANKAFRVYLQFVEHLNALQQYMYRRTPDRDWQMPPWDLKALQLKLHDFETLVPGFQQPQQTSELRDLGA